MNADFRTKHVKVVSLLLSLLAFSQGSYANLSYSCQKELWRLVVPPLKSMALKKSDVRVELDDASNGVYSVRLFVAADSPDNLDKQVSIGWVNLDINTMRAFDVTNDPNTNIELGVDKKKFNVFVKECLLNR